MNRLAGTGSTTRRLSRQPSSRRRLLRVRCSSAGRSGGQDDFSFKPGRLPSQADSVFSPSDRGDIDLGTAVADRPARSVADLDYLSVRGMRVVVVAAGAKRAAWECDPWRREPRHPNSTRVTGLVALLQELLAIQANEGPKNLGFFGTRNMGITHQKLVEILSYAMVSTVSWQRLQLYPPPQVPRGLLCACMHAP